MKSHRVSISLIMVATAIVAIDFGAIRAIYVPTRERRQIPVELRDKVELWARGLLPMANILTIGFLIDRRRQVGRPSLVGFLAFGVVGMIAFAAAVDYACERNYLRYSNFVPVLIRRYHVPSQIVGSIVLVTPQLAFALLGRFLFRTMWPPQDEPITPRKFTA